MLKEVEFFTKIDAEELDRKLARELKLKTYKIVQTTNVQQGCIDLQYECGHGSFIARGARRAQEVSGCIQPRVKNLQFLKVLIDSDALATTAGGHLRRA